MRSHTVHADRSIKPARLTFPDVFNISVPFLDRHLQEGRGSKVLARWRSRELTYGALYRSVLRLGNALRKLGIGPGDRVALFLKDTPAFYQAFLATVRIGAVVVPVNTFFAGARLRVYFEGLRRKSAFRRRRSAR
jgi:acyl-coenzyme A synthetase/AMP-(fatty) acid ligase